MQPKQEAEPETSKPWRVYLLLVAVLVGCIALATSMALLPTTQQLVAAAALWLLLCALLGVRLVIRIVRKRKPYAGDVAVFVFILVMTVLSSRVALFFVPYYSEMRGESEASNRQMLSEIGHAELLAACREVMGQWRDHRPYPGWPGPVPDKGAYLSLWDESLPEEIRSLRPKEIYARDDRVYLKIAGPFGFGVRAFAEGVEGHGDEALIDGLWYYFIEHDD